MLAQQRQLRILELLREQNSVKVSELVNLFHVSIETIRRDLEYLESQGKLKRVHGGAVLEEVNQQELSFRERELKNKKEKLEIAHTAVQFVREGQSIALDVSTTNTMFARVLKEKFRRLTVLTNSLPIAVELSEKPDFTIILAGGVMRNQELCITGDLAEHFLSQFHIDTLFLSMSGISLSAGLTDYGIGEVQIKRKMLSIADKCFVLADSSKFDVISLLKVCDFEQVEGIITDSRIKKGVLERYQNKGIKIITR